MKNTNSSGSGGGRSFFSGWTAPQNPIITLLRRRRESKTQNQPDKNVASDSLKTTKVQQSRNQQHMSSTQQQQQHQRQQQQQQHLQQQQQQRQVISSSIKFHGAPAHNAANDFSLKRVTSGFQPKKIEEYEPGHSSISMKEGLIELGDYNPPICKPGELCAYSEPADGRGFRIRKKTDTQNNSFLGFPNGEKYPPSSSATTRTTSIVYNNKNGTDDNTQNIYKSVLMGGPIPAEGLRHVVEPRKVKTLPTPSTTPSATVIAKSFSDLPNGSVDLDVNFEKRFQEGLIDRLGKKKTRKEVEEEMRLRKQKMEKIITFEKLKKLEEEKIMNEARRHGDNFLPVEKSPVRLNRYDYDDNDDSGSIVRGKTQNQFTAITLYNFKAKNNRELAFRKGDMIHVRKQIDKNWYEGERNGVVGIFPLSYVKIQLPSTKPAKKESVLRGRVSYDFDAKAPPELSLYRGERVTIIGAIDENWVEGRSRNGEGIFPVKYIELIDEDDLSQCSSVYGTPVPSRTGTPSFDHRNQFSRLSLRGPRETPRMVSPVGSIVSSYAPTVPSAPLSPYGSQDLDITLCSNALSDWPTLEASLLDLERVSVSQLMQQQQKQQVQQQQQQQLLRSKEKLQQPQQSGQQRFQQTNTKENNLLENFQHELEIHEQQLLQLERECQPTLQRHSCRDYDYIKSYSSRNSPQQDLLSKSAHPDLCGGVPAKHHSPIKSSITRSMTNPGFPEKNRYGYNQSPSNRYPSLISKDSVGWQNKANVNEMMAMQSEVVAKEFLNRHGSSSSIARDSAAISRANTPIIRHSVPVAKDSGFVARENISFSRHSIPVAKDSSFVARGMFSYPRHLLPGTRDSSSFSRDSVSTIRDSISVAKEGGPATKDSGYEEEVFSFKEIKLVPKLPLDYSKIYAQTRSSLFGRPTTSFERESSGKFQTLSRRSAMPKNYEWHKVIYEYEPRKSDEINLKKGDLIQVIEKCRDGWWLGISQTTGKRGLFPGNYVIPT